MSKTKPTAPDHQPKLMIVYEENPEHISFFLIDAIGNMAREVRKINGLMINSDEFTEEQQKIADRLSEWIVSKNGKAAKRETPIKNVVIVEVIHTGFIM